MRSLHVTPDTFLDKSLSALNSVCWLLSAGVIAFAIFISLSSPLSHASDDGTFDEGFKAGFSKGVDDCGGITCEQLAMAIGEAKKAPHKSKTVSTFMAELSHE